ncbi:hypothetical protein TWF694_009069 [Orbilia ellipsospora]|uniref:Uncharacterized protein n=1 Tax=Orbilia ellipsospora TaxID=2528407 RepID=A0AAV9XGI7_9PEZI
MPSTIPYDPSFVLGNIVNEDLMNVIELIAIEQGKADDAQAAINALMTTKRSLEMTFVELTTLGLPPDSDIFKQKERLMANLNQKIVEVMEVYVTTKLTTEQNILDLRKNLSTVKKQYESPVDFLQTQVKSLPLSSDSIHMDVQYFSKDENDQDSTAYANKIATFVANSVSILGTKASFDASAAAHSQVNSQTSQHTISGTLVISVSCTHKNMAMLAPLVMNVDKAIKVWNGMYPTDALNIKNHEDMTAAAGQASPPTSGTTKPKKFSLLSGVTYGSSFVGMVHVLNTTSTKVGESLTSYATSLQSQMEGGAWFADMSGGFGVDLSIAQDVKSLLSAQNINSHVTMVCMGVIPSIVANNVKIGVEKFAQFDPQSNMNAIATIQNTTKGDQESVKQSAEAARTGQKMVAIKSAEVKAALSALGEIDDGANKVVDINSMMSALEDYLKKAMEGHSGVPINYYVKEFTKDMLAEMWLAKYSPGDKLAISFDDSKPTTGGQTTGGGTGTGTGGQSGVNQGQGGNQTGGPVPARPGVEAVPGGIPVLQQPTKSIEGNPEIVANKSVEEGDGKKIEEVEKEGKDNGEEGTVEDNGKNSLIPDVKFVLAQ